MTGFRLKTFSTSLALVAGRIPSFLIPVVTARVLGVNHGTDAVFSAFALVQFVLGPLTAIIETTSIPYLAEVRSGEGNVYELARAIFTLALKYALVLLVLTILGSLIFDPIALGPGSNRYLVTELVFGFIPYIFLSVLSSTATAALTAEGRYLHCAASPAITNSMVILFILAGAPTLDFVSLVAGFCVGEAARAVWLYVLLRRTFPPSPIRDPSKANLKSLVSGSLAQLVGSAVLGTYPIIDRIILGRGAETGAISILSYAERIWFACTMLLSSGFLTVGLSEWSGSFYNNRDYDELSKRVRNGAITILLLSIPIALGLFLFRTWVGRLILSSNSALSYPTESLAGTFGVLALLIPIYLSGLVYSRGLLVLKRSDLLLVAVGVEISFKLAFSFLLFRRYGIVGLAIATGVMYIAGALVLATGFHLLIKKQRNEIVAIKEK